MSSGADFTTKLLIIAFGKPKSETIYTRQTTQRDLVAERAASGITLPSNINEWIDRYEMYRGTFSLTPALITRIFIDLMVMQVCTVKSVLSGNGIPEFCYDNTVADININGGKPTGIDAHFDLFTWKGLLEVIGLSFLYNGVIESLLYFVEVSQFIAWYGIDSEMAAGSAVFFFGGFDLIGGKYFWGLFDK